MEEKETTASEVSQMEERLRGGWMEEREGGRGEMSAHVGKKRRQYSNNNLFIKLFDINGQLCVSVILAPIFTTV